MSKTRRRKTSLSQKLFLAMSVFIALTMVLSFFISSLPGPVAATATPPPVATFSLPTPIPDTPTAEPSPTQAIPIGPVPPTNTPTVTPTLTATPAALAVSPITPTVTETAGADFTFAVAGDSRHNTGQYAKLLDSVAASGSEFLINLGDLVDSGTEAQWHVFQKVMTGFKLPFYPVPGNHDGLGGKLDGYLKYSGAPALHYSFDRGQVHLAFVDSHNGGLTARELDWLRQDLGTTGQQVKMVFLHHPPFDPDGTEHVMAFGSREFMKLMVDEGVQYVFAGHIHAYAQSERDGVMYTISGGGGAPLYTAGHPQAFYHWLRITVRGQQVSIEVVIV